MSTRIKTRSDYHDLSISDASGFQGLGRFVGPFFWLILGIAIGMFYNQKRVEIQAKHAMLATAEEGIQTVERVSETAKA